MQSQESLATAEFDYIDSVLVHNLAKLDLARSIGDGPDESLQGAVEDISSKVLQNQIIPVNPANFPDSRVVEVWIKVDDSSAVADRIHMRVDVVIQS